MRVLVTGGAGFVGSHTVDLLLEKGYAVRILDSLEPPVHKRGVFFTKKPRYIPKGAEFMIGDVEGRVSLEDALEGIDAIIHLAAHQGYLPDFGKFASVNDVGTALLYETIVKGRLPIQKVVLGSSQAVYGEGKHRCPIHGVQYPMPRTLGQLEKGDWDIRCFVCGNVLEPLPTDEERVNPHNQYAVSKYAQELYALTLGRRYGIPTTALRYSPVQGTRQGMSNSHSGILRKFTVRILMGQPLVIYEDGKQLRDYVSVEDVAEANLLALESSSMDYEVYNVGGDRGITGLEYAKLFCSVWGEEAELKMGEFVFGVSRHIVSDISKLRVLGWKPRVSLPKVIRGYIGWAREQGITSDYNAEAEKIMKEWGVMKSVRKQKGD